MMLSYFNVISEVLACIFRAIGVCVIVLPIAIFLASIALSMHDGLILILGLMAAGMAAIMAVVAAVVELAQAAEEVCAFKRWRAAVQNR